MNAAPPGILLTGFGPFPGMPINASQRLVSTLAKLAPDRFPRWRIACEVLPTEWVAAPQRLHALLAACKPQLLLHFGVAATRTGFSIERWARNSCRTALDAAGTFPPAPLLHEGGPAQRHARLPLEHLVHELTTLGLPASISEDAGGYLCNAVLYHSLTWVEDKPLTLSGFVHIPADIGDHAGAHLTWPDAVRGALAIIDVMLQRAENPQLS